MMMMQNGCWGGGTHGYHAPLQGGRHGCNEWPARHVRQRLPAGEGVEDVEDEEHGGGAEQHEEEEADEGEAGGADEEDGVAGGELEGANGRGRRDHRLLRIG